MRENNTFTLCSDAFSNGQIESKLWLCRELEKCFAGEGPQNIWILGGWYGILAFLLLSREKLNIKSICCFDKDPEVEKLASIINNNWSWKDSIFKAKTKDCNCLSYLDESPDLQSKKNLPSLVINTSLEHFASNRWYMNIPKGTKLAMQSCDMPHKDHIDCVYSEEELQKKFSLTELYFSGTLYFDYHINSFSRYMLIGKK